MDRGKMVDYSALLGELHALVKTRSDCRVEWREATENWRTPTLFLEKADRWLWFFWDNDEMVYVASPGPHAYPTDTLQLAGLLAIVDRVLP